jgi:hypothetical protein
VPWQEVGSFDAAMNDEHPPLIFWNQHQAFGTEFRFHEELIPIQLERIDLLGNPRTPIFFMVLHCTYTENAQGPKYRPGVLGGFDFGIEVPTAWWERVKDSCPALRRVESDPNSSEGVPALVEG